MLKKFFLNMLSSFAGAWIALSLFGVAFFITLFAVIGSFSGDTQSEELKSKSILAIELKGEIEEKEHADDIDYLQLVQGNVERPQTLCELVDAIAEAKVNKNISAIYLKCGALAAAPATLNALRSELVDFKKSGKKVYAYGDAYSTGSYFVASVADSLFLNTDGMIDLHGLGSGNLYFKDLFDKLGISFQVVKVGTFKSAVEPYISNEMSEPARAQLDTLFDGMWQLIRKDIAASRKIDAARIDSMINVDFITLRDGRYLKSNKLVDRLVYEREMDEVLARLVDRKADDLNFVSPRFLAGSSESGLSFSSGSSKKIAVLYATGEIMEGGTGGIDCADLVPVITELADDENVKGLVLRVNSPGGSVFGSEQIGEALDYFKSKKKPFAVSMGDYAASGGYWISCNADRIFADPLTITGSIGIFGLLPNVKGLMNNIGVHSEIVSTNPDANFPTLFRPLTDVQLAAMQTYVERGYDKFVKRVAKGRKMPETKVRRIAEGRVWGAVKAKEIGLVDQLGSLRETVDWVAGKAGVASSYDVDVYPRTQPGVWDILGMQSSFADSDAMKSIFAQVSFGCPDRKAVWFVMQTLRRKPVQAMMPRVSVKL